MDRNFTVKDFILVLLLVVLIGSVWLAIKQYDRQWSIMREMSAEQRLQSRDLALIRQAIQRGVSVGSGDSGEQAGEDDPFARLRAAKAHEDYVPGDWVVDAFGAAVAKLTPLLSTDVYASRVQAYVLESLATRDPETLEWRPLLAESWEISDDGLQITFQMRRGTAFSDGQPVTAEDVAFTYDLIMNPEIDAPRPRAYFSRFTDVEATGEYEVVFTADEPYYRLFEMAAGMEVLPKHFYEGFSPSDINRQPGLLMGSGPYRLTSNTDWTPGTPIRLVRNNRYWGEPPTFDELHFREITDDVAHLQQFRNGEIDGFPAQPEQHIQLLDDTRIKQRADAYEYEPATSGYRFIAWNQRRNGEATRFADPRVRRAMTLLINRDRMAEDILHGYATTAAGPFHRFSNQYNPDVEPWPYSVEEAMSLLSDAGYSRDDRGVLRSAEGEAFRFHLTYPAGHAVHHDSVLFIRDGMARVGIELVPDPQDWSIFGERLSRREFDAITLGWSGTIESDPYQIFHSDQIAEGGDNFVSYRNEELDELISTARTTMDEEERMPMWREVHRILHEDQPYTFLHNSQTLLWLDKRFRNVQLLPLGMNDRTEWYVPLEEHRWTQ